tara:strand:- start:2185 stop:2709 length:525 start_codon:yes stop_codon:yes gene_type:complete
MRYSKILFNLKYFLFIIFLFFIIIFANLSFSYNNQEVILFSEYIDKNCIENSELKPNNELTNLLKTDLKLQDIIKSLFCYQKFENDTTIIFNNELIRDFGIAVFSISNFLLLYYIYKKNYIISLLFLFTTFVCSQTFREEYPIKLNDISLGFMVLFFGLNFIIFIALKTGFDNE